ncbi:developmental pluripotency-associated protein 3 [Microtus ochrogaster]|uniref:Developmental pluripotency-associated protein 3 n=1 Tax=Microtus ochrogaster TaxID=79684 RepID=A0ABM1AU70_MICOH|nr:developmental pluripotency-associated protein 3 [Microtus ochrogaster]
MEKPSEEVVDSLVDSESSQTDEPDSSDDSGISQPDNLEKDMRKLTIDPSAKKPPASLAGLKLQRSRRSRVRILHRAMKMRNVENKSEKILREVQSAFPKRRVRTLLSVQNNPVAKMKRFMRIEKKLNSCSDGNFNKAQPFKCICTFCLYNGWDPSENAKIGKK